LKYENKPHNNNNNNNNNNNIYYSEGGGMIQVIEGAKHDNFQLRERGLT
jgi:hypothetical protein